MSPIQNIIALIRFSAKLIAQWMILVSLVPLWNYQSGCLVAILLITSSATHIAEKKQFHFSETTPIQSTGTVYIYKFQGWDNLWYSTWFVSEIRWSKFISKEKITNNHNTDGMGNCLRQPGLIRNRPQSLCEQIYSHLSNFRYHDYSCYRDKVNRAAGRRASCHGFCIATKTIIS